MADMGYKANKVRILKILRFVNRREKHYESHFPFQKSQVF